MANWLSERAGGIERKDGVTGVADGEQSASEHSESGQGLLLDSLIACAAGNLCERCGESARAGARRACGG